MKKLRPKLMQFSDERIEGGMKLKYGIYLNGYLHKLRRKQMNELKYRAWHEELDLMVEWKDMRIEKDEGDDKVCVVISEGSIGDYYDDFKFLQYVGQQDFTGKEIYVGDILQPSNNEMSYYVVVRTADGFEKAYTFTRYWEGSSWEETTHSRVMGSHHKVIGNIYQDAVPKNRDVGRKS